MKRRSILPKELHTIMISMMFLGGFLLLVVFGARTYQKIDHIYAENQNDRATLSYLFTTLKNDNSSDIVIEGGNLIRIRELEGRYDKVVYVYDGYLMEENTVYDEEIDPLSAVKIAENEILEIDYDEQRHLLKITTSQGSIYINTGMREVIIHE